MATRAKKIVITSVTHEEAEQAMASFAQCNTQLKLIESRMEDEKQQVNNKYLGEITRIKDSMEEQMNRLQFLTIRRHLSLVFAALVALLLMVAIWT